MMIKESYNLTGLEAQLVGNRAKGRISKWKQESIAIRIEKFPVQTPLDTRLGLRTQPRYEIAGDILIEYVRTQWLTSGEWDCPSIMAQSWPWGSQIALKNNKKTKHSKFSEKQHFLLPDTQTYVCIAEGKK